MRVCFIQATFHPFVGGTERQSLQLAQRLKKKGIEVQVVTARFKGLRPFERVDDVPVHRVWVYDSGNKRNPFQTLSWLISAFLFLLFSKRFDIYHAHQALSPAAIALLASKLKGAKCLSKIANTGEAGELWTLNQGLGKLLKPFVLGVDGFIATSRRAKEELLSNNVPSNKIFEIPNGVDTDRFKPVKNSGSLRKKLGLPLSKKLVLYAAKTERKKALPWLSFLLSAWKGVAERVKNAELVVLGKKEFEKDLPKLRSVQFVGLRSNPEDYMAASDVFVLPSSAEGLSNALLEAMSSGLSVVGTGISGTQDLIQQGQNGFLVPPNDKQALEQTLVRLLNHPLPALGKQARETILRRYGFDKVVPRYVDLYKNLLR